MEDVERVAAIISQRGDEILEKTPKIQCKGLESPLCFVRDIQQTYKAVTGSFVLLDTLVPALQDERSPLEIHTCKLDRTCSIVYSSNSPVSRAAVEGLMDAAASDSISSTDPCARPPSARRAYDESDSWDAGLESPTSLTPSTLRSRIVASFSSRSVMPMDSFSTAYCTANGIMLDYRASPCPTPGHPHTSLSRFLRCYSDVLEFLELRRLYIILRTQECQDLSRRRLASHIVERADPAFKCTMEALCVNLLSTKACLPFGDFLELFEHIYKTTLQTLIVPAHPQDFLCGLRSPNIVLAKRNGVYTITLTPTHSREYREWGNALDHKKVRELENQLVQGILEVSDGEREHILFRGCGDGIRKLLAAADLNVPKLLQKRQPYIDRMEYGEAWKYLRQGVNFDGRRPYFTAP